MLSDYPAIPTLAVADMPRARAFYEGVLGFAPASDLPEGVLYASGNGGTIMVYPSAFAGTNKATAVSFAAPADAFDAEVAALRAAGIAFQTFELEGITWDDGVAEFGGGRSVWFEDPDGNILNLETSPS